MTSEKILDRLAKLKQAAEGEAKIGNTAAAEAFAGMINTMLLRYELSEADIPLPGAKEEPVTEVYFDHETHGIPRVQRRVAWQEILAAVVAQAHMCDLIVYPGGNRLTFVGTLSHATVAEYAYGVLARSADQMSIEARDAYWRKYSKLPNFRSGNYRAAWLHGFIERINQRFIEARQREVAASGDTSTALVKIDNALTRVKDYMKENVKRKVKTALPTGDLRGRLDGRNAADKIAIDRRGVTEAEKRKQLEEVK